MPYNSLFDPRRIIGDEWDQPYDPLGNRIAAPPDPSLGQSLSNIAWSPWELLKGAVTGPIDAARHLWVDKHFNEGPNPTGEWSNPANPRSANADAQSALDMTLFGGNATGGLSPARMVEGAGARELAAPMTEGEFLGNPGMGVTRTRADPLADETWISRSPHGSITGYLDETTPAVRATSSRLDPNFRGQGKGLELYQQMVDEAHANGLPFISDNSVSQSAQHVYDALERRGYTVNRNPTATQMSAKGHLGTEGGGVYSIPPPGYDGPALFSDNKPSPLAALAGQEGSARYYHGTVSPDDFSTLQASGNGRNDPFGKALYVSPNPEISNWHAARGDGESGRVFPLDVQGPMATRDQYFDALAKHGFDDGKAQQAIMDQGYSGVHDDSVLGSAVFRPGSVRSATTGETLFSDTGKPNPILAAAAGLKDHAQAAYRDLRYPNEPAVLPHIPAEIQNPTAENTAFDHGPWSMKGDWNYHLGNQDQEPIAASDTGYLNALMRQRKINDGTLFSDTGKPSPLAALAGSENGPIRAYHGTNQKFDTFDSSASQSREMGVHFGDKNQVAARRLAKQGLLGSIIDGMNPFGSWRTIPVDIHASNPAILSRDPGLFSGYQVSKQLVADGLAPESLNHQTMMLESRGNRAASNALVRNWLVENGHDLVQYPNKYEGGGTSYMALGTGNVKHAKTGETLFSDSAPNPLGAAIAGQEGKIGSFADRGDQQLYSDNIPGLFGGATADNSSLGNHLNDRLQNSDPYQPDFSYQTNPAKDKALDDWAKPMVHDLQRREPGLPPSEAWRRIMALPEYQMRKRGTYERGPFTPPPPL